MRWACDGVGRKRMGQKRLGQKRLGPKGFAPVMRRRHEAARRPGGQARPALPAQVLVPMPAQVLALLPALILALMLTAGPAAAAVNETAITGPKPPRTLSEFGFFSDLARLRPDPAMVPFAPASPLFSDHAEKARLIYSPAPAPLAANGLLDFPVGSALVKTFHYGARKVETRVLLRRADGWAAYPYLWNDEGTEAVLKLAGKTLDLDTPQGPVRYRVPNMNQCKACHVDAAGRLQPIGPKLRNLNHGDQLARLVAAGVLAEAPQDAPATPDYRDTGQPLTARARAYLDANCGHCHAPGLPADTSGLYLNWEETRPIHLGVNKKPVAAGRGSGGHLVDIAPGEPDRSILIFRMESTDPGIMMPELGRSVPDPEGIALLRAWIAAME